MDKKSTRAKVVGLVAGLVLILALVYLKLGRENPEAPIKLTIAELQKRSVPPDGRWLERPEPEFAKTSVTAMWKIEVHQSWGEYCRWVEEQFRDFGNKDEGDGTILLLKQLPGDTLRLTIEKIGESPLRVRVSFRGYPS